MVFRVILSGTSKVVKFPQLRRFLSDKMDLGDMRKPYYTPEETFDVDKLVDVKDPFGQFTAWMEETIASKKVEEPNAMVLSTVSKDGQPSSRVLLLKHYDPNGFVFFTSYDSKKGKELAENNKAAILFYWPHFNRQIRVEGIVDQLSTEAADAYWARRPYKSQISAASGYVQSQVVPSKQALVDKIKETHEKYPEPGPVPRPTNWGGYRLEAKLFEFWQGQTNRDHDRLQFLPTSETDEAGNVVWKVERLAP